MHRQAPQLSGEVIMKEKEFDFWQDHSMQFLEMAFRSDRRETVSNPDGSGTGTSDCGDTVTFFLTIKGGRIETVSFSIYGCLNINACANTVCELVEGKSVEEAWSIEPKDVINYLETLGADHNHCAELVVGALRLALEDLK